MERKMFMHNFLWSIFILGIGVQQRHAEASSQLKWKMNSLVPLNRSKPSLASVVACMMPFMLGVCFLCPSMDCLWHKYHYCPSCGEKVGLRAHILSVLSSLGSHGFSSIILWWNSAGGWVQEVWPVPRRRCGPVVRAELRRACVVA